MRTCEFALSDVAMGIDGGGVGGDGGDGGDGGGGGVEGGGGGDGGGDGGGVKGGGSEGGGGDCLGGCGGEHLPTASQFKPYSSRKTTFFAQAQRMNNLFSLLKDDAYCRESKEVHAMRGEMRGERPEVVWQCARGEPG